MSYLLIRSDARRVPLRDASIHCVISSPPYFNLRDYGTGRWESGNDPGCEHRPPVALRATRPAGGLEGGKSTVDAGTVLRDLCPRCGARRVDRQIGLERDVDSYVAALVAAFREVRRVLRDDGLAFLNLGDSYSAVGKSGGGAQGERWKEAGADYTGPRGGKWRPAPDGLGSKQLLMIPHRVALALQADGWIVRMDMIWSKANAMPESVKDRPSKSHEYVFILAKQPRYFWDAVAVKRPQSKDTHSKRRDGGVSPYDKAMTDAGVRRDAVSLGAYTPDPSGCNLRSVLSIPTSPFKGSHFAVMPARLAALCIRAGTSAKGCCPHCSAPWRRVTESVRKPTRPGTDSKVYLDSGPVLPGPPDKRDRGVCGNRDPRRHVSETTTVGWEPSCKCPAHAPTPCTVADFFCGAGTTILTATALGRRAVGCDLSHDYLTMARDRIDRPHRKAPRPAPADGDDLPLFRRDDS